MHGCNMQGVMGSGVAKIVKDKYPKAFEDYKNQVGFSQLGDVIYSNATDDLIIANALTQTGYGRNAQRYVSYHAVKKAFMNIAEFTAHSNSVIRHVHFPLIGAGLGGGDWAIISDIIRSELNKYEEIKYTLWIQD